jgi:hypothetical protein
VQPLSVSARLFSGRDVNELGASTEPVGEAHLLIYLLVLMHGCFEVRSRTAGRSRTFKVACQDNPSLRLTACNAP